MSFLRGLYVCIKQIRKAIFKLYLPNSVSFFFKSDSWFIKGIAFPLGIEHLFFKAIIPSQEYYDHQYYLAGNERFMAFLMISTFIILKVKINLWHFVGY